MVRSFLVVFICSISFAVCAGSAQVDSLERVLTEQKIDSEKVKVLIALAQESYLSSPEKALDYCKGAFDISSKENYETGLMNSLGWLAFLSEQQGKITDAISYNRKSLAFAEKLHNPKDEAAILNNLGAIFKDQGQIDTALVYHQQSLAISKKLKNKAGMATSYNNLGFIFFTQGKIQDALTYYSKALQIEEELKDNDGISTALINIAGVYKDQKQFDEAFKYYRQSLANRQKMNDSYGMGYALNGIGSLFEEQGNLDSALSYYQQALSIRRKMNDKQGIAYTLKSIGIVYEKRTHFVEAKDYFTQSLNTFKELGDKWGIASATNRVGEVQLLLGDTKAAEVSLQQSLQLAKELGYPTDIKNAAGNLQQLYRNKQDWKRALQMFDTYIEMRDSIQNDNNKKASLQTQFKYEFEKKALELKNAQDKKDAQNRLELNRQKFILNAVLIGFLITLAFGVVLFIQRNRLAKEKQRSEKLLLNVLPAEVAEELKQKGHTEARQFDNVTVLFTDFKEFSIASEKMTPGQLLDELDVCFRAFDEIVTKYGIEKLKTVGDAYLAVCGLPTAKPNHAEDVVRASLEIATFMRERKQVNPDSFEVRIGIHSGAVVAGVVGVKKFAYDIWGDTVNTAARMEQNSETGKINISQTTYELIKDKFVCTYGGEIEAKNKGKLKMYFVEKEE